MSHHDLEKKRYGYTLEQIKHYHEIFSDIMKGCNKIKNEVLQNASLIIYFLSLLYFTESAKISSISEGNEYKKEVN